MCVSNCGFLYFVLSPDADYDAAERNLEYYTNIDDDDDDDLDDYDDDEAEENDSENIIDDDEKDLVRPAKKRKQRNQERKISRDNDKVSEDAGRESKKDILAHRYSPPAPERRKLDAHLLDSEVGFESVLNFDENKKSAEGNSIPERTREDDGESDVDLDRDNFLDSDGGQHFANLASESSVCSPQEYEILKVREVGRQRLFSFQIRNNKKKRKLGGNSQKLA